MLYRSPDELPKVFINPSVFVAGGISNCPDWQSDVIQVMNCDKFDVINPRRLIGFDSTGNTAREQITWEHDALRKTSSIIFWFPKETLCPITLFELGMALERFENYADPRRRRASSLIIGWHPEYARAFDLEGQIGLASRSTGVHAEPGWDEFLRNVSLIWGK